MCLVILERFSSHTLYTVPSRKSYVIAVRNRIESGDSGIEACRIVGAETPFRPAARIAPDHRKLHAFRLERFLTLIALAGICTGPAGLPAVMPPDPQDDAASTLSRIPSMPRTNPVKRREANGGSRVLQAYAKSVPE